MARSGSQSRVSWTMRSPGLERARLPPDLVLERVAHVPERVHVLDLDLGAVLGLAARPERDVGVAAERALLHVAVAHAQVDQDRAERLQVGGGLLRALEVGLGDDLHQRHPGPVEVHAARGRGLERALVDELAHVLLEVHALDADLARPAARVDREAPVLGERLLVLADLVVLRHVGVVVVLAREAVQAVHRAAERQGGHRAELDGAAVDHRERAGQAQADRAGLGVRRRAEGGPAAAEHLGHGRELRVHFQADDGLVAVCVSWRSGHQRGLARCARWSTCW